MAKLVLDDVLNIIGNPNSAQNTINSNSNKTEIALENTLSRDGTSPNQMLSDLDMNNQDILNANSVHAEALYLDGRVVVPTDLGSVPPNSIGTNELVNNSVTDVKINPLSALYNRNRGYFDIRDPQFTWVSAGTATARTLALQAAINAAAAAGVALYVPANTVASPYVINDEIKIPNNFIGCTDGLLGGYVRRAYFKLDDGTASTKNVFTNLSNNRQTTNTGNSNIVIQGWGAIGNKNNRTGLDSASIGPSTSGCGFGFSFVTNVTLIDIYSADNPLHGIDINAAVYGHGSADNIADYGATYGFASDDETYGPGASSNIMLIRPVADQNGDDNITTHNSHDITIIDPVSTNPSGTYTANSNCIEIDDGSQRVTIRGGRTTGGACGLQIKGHDDAVAAQDVTVDGMICQGAVQNFAVFHIGHRSSSHPSTPTGKGVKLVNCVSLNPVSDPTFIDGSGTDYPRHLALSSYEDVDVVNFTARGNNDPDFSTYGTSIYNAAVFIGDSIKDLKVNGLHIYENSTMAYGLIVEGDARGIIGLNGVTVYNSGFYRGILLDSAIPDIYLNDYYINPPGVVDGSSYGILAGATTRTFIGSGHIVSGYTVKSRVNAVDSTGDVQFNQADGGFNWEGPGYFLNSLFAGNIRANAYDQSTLEGMSYVDGESLAVARSAATPFYVNRLTSDGSIVSLQRGGVSVGGLSAYGTRAHFRPSSSESLFFTSAAGSPEGVITANIGSFYTDTTNGVAYMKKSGTGNTGWKLVTQAA